MTNLSINGIIGAELGQEQSKIMNKISLALNAEVIQRLISLAGKPYCSKALVDYVIKTISFNDRDASKLMPRYN